ncbi:MAG: hypothetical protein FWD90_02960 [Defluviitaleaceae bacterium]|nr:hypothetical protein [Defluviitaleaceae bacterium]
MDNTFPEQIKALHVLFENGFADAYRVANTRKRRRVIPYAASMYRRWYYSTLIENTPFSPANIMESICLHYRQDAALYPQSVLRSVSKFSGFEIKLHPYGGERHPVIDDLARLIGYCLPHVDLQEGNYFFDAQQMELAQKLTIPDPAYAAFLLEVALKMKLLAKIPSLYVNRLEVTRDWEEKSDKPPAEFFKEIVEAAVAVCAFNMRELIALPELLFTDSFVRAMLTDPIETDALFEQVYDILGYTLEDLIELSMDSDALDFESQDGAFLAGTFMMGVVLDRHFFTPFGHFLKLIKPLYVLPFDFGGEVEDFIGSKEDVNDGIFVAFYAPCSNYTLTDLGLRTLNVKPGEHNYYDVARNMPFTVLQDSLFADPEMIEVLVKMAQLLPSAITSGMQARPIYTFRIRMESDPTLWIHLHMPANAYLYEIYDEVLLYFPLRENYDYIFFHDKIENRFAQYPSPKRAAPNAKKTAETQLDALDFEHQPRMLLTTYNQALPFGGKPPTVRLEIEMLGRKQPDPGHDYPRVTRMSKAMQNEGDAESGVRNLE